MTGRRALPDAETLAAIREGRAFPVITPYYLHLVATGQLVMTTTPGLERDTDYPVEMMAMELEQRLAEDGVAE